MVGHRFILTVGGGTDEAENTSHPSGKRHGQAHDLDNSRKEPYNQ
jgi:hypothetical protein